LGGVPKSALGDEGRLAGQRRLPAIALAHLRDRHRGCHSFLLDVSIEPLGHHSLA
jgi:hypothetical protein